MLCDGGNRILGIMISLSLCASVWYNISHIVQQDLFITSKNFICGLTICHGHKHSILSATHNVLFNIPDQNRTYSNSAIYRVVLL